MMASASCGLNAGLDADFRTEAFEHVAFFDEANSWIEMRLRANGAQTVRIDGADLELTFADGEEIRTEISAKAFNGAVALSLVQRGRLELDDTIGGILPALPAAWASVTLGQLLQHTSGVPNYTDSPGWQAALNADPKHRFTPMELVGYVANDQLNFAPGTSYTYSNTDNIIAALMAEAVSGRTYEGLLRSAVYDRLDLGSTTMPSGSALPRPFARGYLFEGGGPPEDVSTAIGMSSLWASGGSSRRPRDLLRFMRGYVGGKLFGPALQRAQRRWRPGGSEPPGPGVNSAGMSLFRYRLPCGT